MVTRRAVLKGTAAASIGAIAAAHGAEAAEGFAFDVGYGDLTGAVGGFNKLSDAFQIALKFNKGAVELFYKEQPSGGVAVFYKLFQKVWSPISSDLLENKFFPDLKTSDVYFQKIWVDGAELLLKRQGQLDYIFAKVEFNSDGLLELKYDLISPSPILE